MCKLFEYAQKLDFRQIRNGIIVVYNKFQGLLLLKKYLSQLYIEYIF